MLIATTIQFFFIRGLIYVIGGLVSVKRVEEYLFLPEVLNTQLMNKQNENKNEVKELKVEDLKHETMPYVRVNNLSASWKVCI